MSSRVALTETLKVDKTKNVENNGGMHQVHCKLVDPLGTKTSFLTSGSCLNESQ